MSHRLRTHRDWQVLTSFALALVAIILGGLAIALVQEFSDDINALPDALETLLGFCLWTTIPLGIIAATWAWRVRALTDHPSALTGWGIALGFSTILLCLIGIYLWAGASLNTIGP